VQRERGIKGLLEYWKPFELHSVQRLLEDYPADHVLAFGGGQSVYTDEDDTLTAAKTLSTSRVVLLLPSEDLEESVPILLGRIRVAAPELPDSIMASVESLVREQFLSTSNRRLANDVVYNAKQSVGETVHAILAALQ
ncbi:MAG: shikimate kinase, partial [Pseudonocardiales bacterium]|nr:shikimate kinase [Pseudonocardiales bacterium]